MKRNKFDGVVEAVHYTPDGQVEWVRAYERRGPTFSDYVLIRREALVARLQEGKRFVVGARKIYEASTFEVGAPVRLNAHGALVMGESQTLHDQLDSVPVM